MNFVRQLVVWLSGWIDNSASALLSIGSAIRPARTFRVVEQEDLVFLVQAVRTRSARPVYSARIRLVDGQLVEDGGARVRSRLAGAQVEIVLARRQFVCRLLELPRQASGFLEAIVRSQIDRLTPWSPAQAAFGCSPPKEISYGRVGVIVAATARSAVMPFVLAIEAFKPGSILVSVASEDGGDDRRTIVFSRSTHRDATLRRLRRILVAAPAAMGLAALSSFAAWVEVTGYLDKSQLQVSRRMAERRAELSGGSDSVFEQATAKLGQMNGKPRRLSSCSESLSQALPNDTYLTELRVADGKLEISGVSQEASSLIRIMEQTGQFKDATFFAPTTRAPFAIGEQFHIRAEIVPIFPEFP